MKLFFNYLLFLFLGITLIQCPTKQDSQTKNIAPNTYRYVIPLEGNSWTEDINDNVFTYQGMANWSKSSTIIITYFKTSHTGEIKIGLVGKVDQGKSALSFTMNGKTSEKELTNTTIDTIYVGNFEVTEPGYQKLQIQGISKEAAQFAKITSILITGEATNGEVHYAKDEFYWSRRGPSVHLSYYPPDEAEEAVWFYNEINIPDGEDVMGSYFMANGFGEGYFGIQVNSETERRILFSVWSPFQTDNPNDIPEDQRIKLLKKGDNVHTGKFGNEGSGGQSYRKYLWKAESSYRFLLKGVPSENNCTDYAAYFFAPEIGKWELIASFRRPKTSTYLTRHHSFLENFIPNTGNITRKGLYHNQWICDKSGNWHEMTKARFKADNTARKENRMDYSGGVEGNKFFMKNCGFFSETTEIDKIFTREATNNQPDINFSKLP